MLMSDSVRVLRMLREDARLSRQGLSLATGFPPEAVDMICSDLECGALFKYTSILDYRRLNLLRIHVAVDTLRQDDLERYLGSHQGMNAVARTPRGFYIDMVFTNLANLYRFLEELQEFDPKRMDVYHIIEGLKEESFAPAEQAMVSAL